MKRILIILTFSSLALLLIHPVYDRDTWMHIKSGELMMARPQIMSIDEYSFTMEGRKWLNHQWLSQIIFYIIYRLFGVSGIVLLQATVIFSAFILLFRTAYREHHWLLSIFLLSLVILFSIDAYLMRPLIFSIFLFSLYLYILHRYKYIWDIKKSNIVYLLVPLQVLWVNLHGASILGIFLVWSFIIGTFIDNRFRKNFHDSYTVKGEKFNKLLLAGIMLIVSAGVTPYGYRAIIFPIVEINQMSLIREWLPAVHKDILLNFGFMPYYRSFLLIAIFIFIYRAKYIASYYIICFTVLLYLSLSAGRHLPFFGFSILPCIMQYFKGPEHGKITALNSKYVAGLTAIISIGLFIHLLSINKDIFIGRYYVEKGRDIKVAMGKEGMPDNAIDFILRTGLKGNMFNDYASGCYLIWRLYPYKKVFIDGRNTIYGPEFIKENYIDCLYNPELFELMVKKYSINYVFLNYGISSTAEIIPYLYNSDKWAMVYFDDKSCIFVRNIIENQDVINRYEVDLRKPRPVVSIKAYDWQSIYPTDYINRAAFYERIGFLDMGIDVLRQTIILMPEIGDLHYNLGSIYIKKGMLEEALKEFSEAVRINRKDVDAYNNLGMTYARMGRYDKAIRQLRNALWYNPLHIEARQNLALALRDYELQREKFSY